MMVNRMPELPDYPLEDRRVVVAPHELKAMAYPLRSAILDLVLERAATVTELAEALQRPKSTIAHHVAVLVAADMLKVVRTHRVRAIEERFYGRTARLFFVGEVDPADVDPPPGRTLFETPCANPMMRIGRTACGRTRVTRGSAVLRRAHSGRGSRTS